MTYEFSWLLFLSFYYYYYYLWMWLLNSLLYLVCTGNVDTITMKSSSLRLIKCTFVLSFATVSFFVTHLLSFSSRTISQQMPAVSFSSFLLLPVLLVVDFSTFPPSPSPCGLWFFLLFSSLFFSLLDTLPVPSDQTRVPPDQPMPRNLDT